MSFTPITLTKTWEDPRDFPTIETSEAQVREDLQYLFTELANGINAIANTLLSTTAGESGASSIGAAPVTGISGTNLQAMLNDIGAQLVLLNQWSQSYGITRAEADTLYEPLTSAALSFQGVSFNSSTGVLTMTKKNGTTATATIPLGKIPATMALVARSGGGYNLVITNQDGSTTSCNVSDLLNSSMPIDGGTW